MRLTDEWTDLNYHAVQSALWYTEAKYCTVLAGRGSGKTELARRRVVRWLPVKKPWPDPIYFYALPTYQQAKRVAWRKLLKLIPPSWIVSTNTSELLIETIFGSSLYVIGMNKPMRAEGVQWDGGVIDESSDQPEKVFDVNFLPAFSHRNPWCWRIGVPKRNGTGALDFKNACATYKTEQEKGNLNYAHYHWESADIVPEDILELARSYLDPKDFDEQYGASWQSATGAVYYSFDDSLDTITGAAGNVCEDAVYNPAIPLEIGSDFNVSPMSWVVAQWSNVFNRLLIIDQIYLNDCNTPRALTTLWSKYKDHRAGFEFYGDATGQARKTSASKSDYLHIVGDSRFDEFKSKKVRYSKGNPARIDRYASVNAMLCSADGMRHVKIHPSCKKLIDDLTIQTHEDNAADVGHITDAMGYLIHYKYPLRARMPRNEKAKIFHKVF